VSTARKRVPSRPAAGRKSPPDDAPWLAAIDTNVLVYAEGEGDAARCAAARRLVAALPAAAVVLPVQALGELHRVLVRKARRNATEAAAALQSWADAFTVADSSWAAMQSALDLCSAHQLQVWDALMIAVAAEHRCRLLLSEDMQAGFIWRGVTVVNPFDAKTDPLLADLLR
jgi:predicted nucleic acid-binding protein